MPEPPTAVNRDFRQEATNSIIEMLEKGTAPWQKPWDAQKAFELPFNPNSQKPYRGGNALHLMAVTLRKGYEDPRWLTYRQAQENGWQVRKGEKGTQIEFWQFRSEPGRQQEVESSMADQSRERPWQDRSIASTQCSMPSRSTASRRTSASNLRTGRLYRLASRSSKTRARRSATTNAIGHFTIEPPIRSTCHRSVRSTARQTTTGRAA